MTSSEDSEISAIAQWFAQRGFGLKLSQEKEDLVWANLTRPSSGEVVAPMYGRGETRLDAAKRARQRYEQEQ